MDPKFRSSFIPKKAITPDSGKPKVRRRASFLSVVSGLIFVFSLIGAGGVVGYEFILQNRINEKGNELKNKLSFVNTERIAELKVLHNKLRAATNLIDSHIAFTLLFDHLEEITLQDVQFKNYVHRFDPDDSLQVELGGIARDYGTLVLQSEAFAKSAVVSSANFFDFSLDERGNVKFQVNILLNTDTLTYRNTLNSR